MSSHWIEHHQEIQKWVATDAGFGTRAVHAGQRPDPNTGAVIPALSLSTTFLQPAVAQLVGGFDYSRSGNPTRKALEEAVAALEGGQYGLAFASGSATTASVFHLFPHGSHVISVNDVYGGTFRYATKVASVTQNIETSFVDLFDPRSIVSHLRPNTKLIWIETPTNPTLRLVDIEAVCKSVRALRKDIVIAVDNTFLSPYFQKPLRLGADLVVHSMTKYLNGHSDAVMGIAITNDASLHQRLAFLQNSIGAVPSPFDCFLVNRGLKTLHLRMQQHAKNAMAVAQALTNSSLVEEVIYPGLPSHRQHALACRQQSGFGGMITVRLRGNLQTAERFMTHLKLFTLAESLGGVESLCELPALMTHASLTPEARASLGITETLVRLSVGVEETEDLVQDVLQALAAAQ